jgi:hypothetical protein
MFGALPTEARSQPKEKCDERALEDPVPLFVRSHGTPARRSRLRFRRNRRAARRNEIDERAAPNEGSNLTAEPP